MEIHQLRYFVAVVESGSFTRAARRCHVAQPSLSQQIRKLESELGQPLFDRLPTGALLTDAGSALLPRARRILDEVQGLEASISHDLDSGRGRLVVGSIPTMAPYLLPVLIPRFTKRFPLCELTLVEDLTDRLVEQVIDHRIDLAILSTPIDNDAIDLEVLASERLLMVAPRGHSLLADPSRLTSGDIEDQPAVVLDDLHCLGEQLENFCSASKVARRIVCRSTQLTTILQMVGLGLGISFIPEMAARADRSALREYAPIREDGPVRDIAIARHPSRQRSALATAFEQLLREDLESGRHAWLGSTARAATPDQEQAISRGLVMPQSEVR